ncbi:MAG: hypothetical protein HYR85_06975 [Planctomycetes bacterium]|nr:hypothetical protein [Planctomycetota bacterium]MBI3843908.1 hypothetical protein [Planctomycetota bacterium]
MQVIAVITDPRVVDDILGHHARGGGHDPFEGRAPSGEREPRDERGESRFLSRECGCTTGLTFAARPVGALEFESTNRPQRARLVLSKGEGGKITSITQTMADAPDVRLTPIEVMTDVAAGLADFEGTYDSDETGKWMKASVSGGQLRVVYFEDSEPYPVGRDEPNGFSVPGLEWIFTRGSDGKVDGLIVSTPRTKGVRYVKRAPG